MKRDTSELIGKRFNQLMVMAVAYTNRRTYYECKCDCGNTKILAQDIIAAGRVLSCGCARVRATTEKNTKHGMAPRGKRSPENRIWGNMKQRCFNPNNPKYVDYGGRGITMCDRWRDSFADFVADVGLRPHPKAEIDRINNDGNYEPGNVRWTDRATNVRNRRNSLILTHNGESMSVKDWAVRLGIPPGTIYSRILVYGWDVDRALSA